jgi:hypothetical protein
MFAAKSKHYMAILILHNFFKTRHGLGPMAVRLQRTHRSIPTPCLPHSTDHGSRRSFTGPSRDERKCAICKKISLTDSTFQPKYVAMTVGKSVALCEWSMGYRMLGSHMMVRARSAPQTYNLK